MLRFLHLSKKFLVSYNQTLSSLYKFLFLEIVLGQFIPVPRLGWYEIYVVVMLHWCNIFDYSPSDIFPRDCSSYAAGRVK